MDFDARAKSFAVLFFERSSGEADTTVLYISQPAPAWLGVEKLSEITVIEPGMYCMFFLISAEHGASAEFSVNMRPVPGSLTTEENGALCSSAVCSIRERALPCTLHVDAKGAYSDGFFVVAKFDV